jgi:glutamate-1-semialdehyde 2,1-aminomutase
VKAGSGVATLGLPDSPGVPAALAGLTLTAPFNEVAAVEDVFTRRGREIAAVIVEPFIGNAGFIPPEPGFHEALRGVCDRHGALLIFDEVMTGFRVAAGGAQQRLGIRPDLVTLGKVIGGGMPVGAYGGRADLGSPHCTKPRSRASTRRSSGGPRGWSRGWPTARGVTTYPRPWGTPARCGVST